MGGWGRAARVGRFLLLLMMGGVLLSSVRELFGRFTTPPTRLRCHCNTWPGWWTYR